MNRGKWVEIASMNPTADDVLLPKLMEEVGEVAKAHVEQTTEELAEELRHVVFIAQLWLWRLNGWKGHPPGRDIR